MALVSLTYVIRICHDGLYVMKICHGDPGDIHMSWDMSWCAYVMRYVMEICHGEYVMRVCHGDQPC